MTFLFADYITAIFIFFGAILYSSVGHGGASSYIAIMSIMGTPISSIKPIGLVLNLFVSSISSYRYIKNDFFSKEIFWPVILGSVPAAFLGGYIELSPYLYKPLIGFVLIVAGSQLLFNFYKAAVTTRKPVNILLAVICGSIIGLLSGLTGTGGGIFLSPIIFFLGWTNIKEASGTAAAFIFLNSLSGLLGNISSIQAIPPAIFLYTGSVIAGVLIGTQLGLKHLNIAGIKKALGMVLIIAGIKFLLI